MIMDDLKGSLQRSEIQSRSRGSGGSISAGSARI
jgi:hypothetical protein